jgi:hypothetical protein
MRSTQLRILPRQLKRRSKIGAEQLEPRRLLSYTLHTLAGLGTSNLSDPSDTIVQDTNGDLFFSATQGSSASGNEAICKLAKGSSTPTVLTTVNSAQGNVRVMTIDSAGDLFGVSNANGANNEGFVWEIVAGSNTLTTLASFTTATTGSDPTLGYNLVLDPSGNLFGTCQVGGSDDGGTVWELPKASSTITALASFQRSVTNQNVNGLTIDSHGNLFGTFERDITVTGAFGGVWELPVGSSTINILASFNGANGNGPECPLVVDSNGDVFGESNAGGTGVSGNPNVGDGDIYEIPAGSNSVTVLASFTGANGSGPSSGIVTDSAGDLFGSAHGGPNNHGVIYELPKGSSTITAIQTFDSTDTGSPSTTLIIDSNGDFFAGTPDGGPSGGGIIFELTPGGSSSGGGGGTSSLTGAVTGKIPASTIAGQKVNISQSVAVTDGGSSAVSGTVGLKLFLSSGTSVDSSSIQLASTSKTLKLKSHGRAVFNFKVPTIPASTPNGTYHLVAQLTDPSGITSDATSTSTIIVAPAQNDLSGTFSKQPVPGKNGKTALTFTVSQEGNIPAEGTLALNVDSSPDGQLADATVITTPSKKINIKPGKSTRITVTITLPAGTYFVIVQLDPADAFHDVNLANNTFATSARLTVT